MPNSKRQKPSLHLGHDFLTDHNPKGYAVLLSGSILSGGWLDWVPIRFLSFEDMALSINSDDRVVWQFAQANNMILLTANRSMKGDNSLEQVMREEMTSGLLPVMALVRTLKTETIRGTRD